MVVLNTSPISCLALIGRLGLLQELYGRVLVPEAVRDELARAPLTLPVSALVHNCPWIETCAVRDGQFVERLLARLHRGEAEAIALAKEAKAEILLLDEQRGRKVAASFGLNCVGTVGCAGRGAKEGACAFGPAPDRRPDPSGRILAQHGGLREGPRPAWRILRGSMASGHGPCSRNVDYFADADPASHRPTASSEGSFASRFLALDRNHVADVETARGEDRREDLRASGRAAAPAAGHADADGRLAPHPRLACLVHARAAEAVEKRPQALAQVAEIDRRREDGRIRLVDLDQPRQIVFDDAPPFLPAQAPAVVVALPGSVRAGAGAAAPARRWRPCRVPLSPAEQLGQGRLSLRIPGTVQDDQLHHFASLRVGSLASIMSSTYTRGSRGILRPPEGCCRGGAA